MSRDFTRPGRTEVLRTRRPDPAMLRVLRASIVTQGTQGPRPRVLAETHGEPLTIGRSRTTSLTIDDPTVSAVHVELTPTPDGIRIQDRSSSNGTVYAGAFVSDIIVASGASIRVGRTEVLVELFDTGHPAAAYDVEEVGRLCGTSGVMRALYALVRRVAPTPLPVLVEGEEGTEKDLIARAIHDVAVAPGGHPRPLQLVDCAGGAAHTHALLFGDGAGAGGALEAARGGTLVLLDVDALPLDVQATLEGALALGAGHGIRFVATAHDLAAAVNRVRFREDLYEMLASVRIRVPALRDRMEDVPALAYRVLQDLPAEVEAARTIARDALSELKRREWPGNLRELRAAVERAAFMASGSSITAGDLAFERRLARERGAPNLEETGDTLTPFKDAKRSLVDEFERGYLVRLMERAGGSVTKAATIAGLERHHVRDLLRKHGLHPGGDGRRGRASEDDR